MGKLFLDDSIAAKYGKIKCIKALLATPGMLVNKKTDCGKTALHIATKYGNIVSVKLLLATPRHPGQ